jgi:hypothetical protein
MVMTGYGKTELVCHAEAKLPAPHHIAADLYEAVEWILK